MNDLISRQALCEYALNQKDKSITPNDIMRFPSTQQEQDREFIKLEVRNLNGRLYYSIIYLEFDDNGVGHDFEGYSSYSLDVISDYLKKYFMPSAQPEQAILRRNAMSEYKSLNFFCKPPEPWYHEPVKCHKVPEKFWDETGVLKVMHLTKHKHDNFFTFTVKCDYGPYAYFTLHRNYDVNMNEVYVTLEANIGLYRYAHWFRSEEFGDLDPDSRCLNYVIAVAYRELLKGLGHPLYHCMSSWKVKYDEAELRAFRSSCRKEDDNADTEPVS